jgi:hypothetical protein
MSESTVQVAIGSTGLGAQRAAAGAVHHALSDVDLPSRISFEYVGEAHPETRGIPTEPIEAGVITVLTITILQPLADATRDRLVAALRRRLDEVWRRLRNPPGTVKIIYGPNGKVLSEVKLPVKPPDERE